MISYLRFSLLFFIVLPSYAHKRVDPLVQTKVGLIRGLHAKDGKYSMFLGIPYAQINKNNPFGEHILQPPFEDVFNAFDDSAMCPQSEEFNNTITGTLACLHINVYVPESAGTAKPLPVMVYIHGGAFDYGYGGRIAQGPAYIVKHDVILVTLNYRVNVYGFMCLDIPEVPGNQGLRDQQAALNWIKDNIAAFGGNENLITIVGESAGAASVDLHLRYGKGDLFQKVIMQSGSASSFWGIQIPDYESAMKLAKELGFEAEDTKSALAFLNTANPHDVVAAFLRLDLATWPCVEKEFGQDRFITDYAMNIPIPKAKTTPIMTGFNNEEWLSNYLFLNDDDYKKLDFFRKQLSENFVFTDEELSEMAMIIKRFYIGDNELSSNYYKELSNFESDLSFMNPNERSIVEYLENGASSIYRYVFSYNGQRNFVKRRMNVMHVEGAFHADELGYLFDISFFKEQPNENDQQMIDRITTMWTNFVKFSNPTPEVTELLPVKWEKVDPEKSYYLDIGSELVVGTRPMHDRIAFWDLFYKLNEKKRIGYKNKEL